MKICFERYDIRYRGHNYCILIPQNTEQLRFYVYPFRECCQDWMGNRAGLEALMYSAVIMGFNPKDKIIYFPTDTKRETECERNWRERVKMVNIFDRVDLVFVTPYVQFQRSRWKKIKKILRYVKPKSYTLHYDEKRTKTYFERSVEKWKGSPSWYKKEYAIGETVASTHICAFSRHQFQQVYLSIHKFLKRNLEQELIESWANVCAAVYQYLWIDQTRCWHRKKKQMLNGIELIFYDERLAIELEKEKGTEEHL